ncbi:MAG: ATP-dependent DNA ligase, partial [Planctomycetota bacterium]|nr:ATP-dependent DNA ligase [Planctomycetota bacterium]
HALQRRIQRKSVSAKLRAEVPVRFVAYDLLEEGGEDLRTLPLAERRARLAALVPQVDLPHLGLAPIVEAPDWEGLAALRETSRERGVEGLMLKRRDAAYGAGRVRGPWWKWKVDPFTIDTVLVYAQRGHGRRASLYTDYTLAVWSEEGELVPVAKAYSGLTDAEIRRVDAFVRRNITDRFGPVRVVKPDLVFEIAFEGIQPSPRHKAGIALRFPRIARWREDKPPAEADTLASVRALLEQHS